MKIYFNFIYLSLFSTYGIAQSSYNFLAAGHVYGHHTASNDGLHPAFLSQLQSFDSLANEDFIFLTGDIVRSGNVIEWETIASELNDLDLDSYYVMGNHDDTAEGQAVFQEKHGGTYYSLMHNEDLFIVLDQELSFRSISDDQIEFLAQELENNEYRHVFLFFHMLLWNGDAKYSDVESNFGSQYNLMAPYSNYWEDVHPILNTYCNHNIFVITGDVGGRPEVISAYFDQCGHIRMIASGMGETFDENFMEIEVTDTMVSFNLFPLNDSITMLPLEEYNFTTPVFLSMYPEGDIIICEDDTAFIEVELNDTFSFEWLINDILSETTSLFQEAWVEGTYVFTATDGTCIASRKAELFLEPIPEIPIITFENNELHSNCETNNQWYFEEDLLVGATSGILVPTVNGNYSVLCNSECPSLMSEAYFYSNVFVTDVIIDSEIVFNINSSEKTIQISNFNEKGGVGNLYIYSVQGKLLKNVVNLNENQVIDIGMKGVFFYHFEQENNSFKGKFIF